MDTFLIKKIEQNMELNLFTFGTKLRVRNALLVLELPEQDEQTFSGAKIELIRVGTGIILSSDVVMFAKENEIDLIFEKERLCPLKQGLRLSVA